MQPLEFVKLTPMSNCRECGYPACLAFAAAVTKGGEDPGKCPYVDRSRLAGLPSRADRGSGGLAGVAGRLEAQDLALVAHLKEKTGHLNFQTLAPRLDCQWRGGEGKDGLHFSYLGQRVELSHTQLLIDGHEAEDPRDQILLYNYLHFGGGKGVAGEWIGMESMPNSISKVRTLKVYGEERIASCFSGRPALLQACSERSGGERDPLQEQSCSLALRIAVLPMLPLLLLFWDEEREEQFPARVKVLFDRNALSVLDLESLVFTAERMAERLEALRG